MKEYIRKHLYSQLEERLLGEVNLIQAVVGPRQVGKTTLVRQILKNWKGSGSYDTADDPAITGSTWIGVQWEKARIEYLKTGKRYLLILDEIQKLENWSSYIKKYFDEDRLKNYDIRPVILGSSSLLMQKGLTESLAGRFELHRHYQWPYYECKECFNLSQEEYLYFGGYPGALMLRKDEDRWVAYIKDSLIEAVIAKDILFLSQVSKPILMRQTFGYSAGHPAEIISYQKMIGTLTDAGNATTIANYLHLLSNAFIITPLEKYSGMRIGQKASTPKILVHDNGIVNALKGISYAGFLADKDYYGRVFENSIGINLYNSAKIVSGEIFYWRERNYEVDYVVKAHGIISAIEVKSGNSDVDVKGLKAFKRKYPEAVLIVISKKEVKIDGVTWVNPVNYFNNPEIIFVI